MATKVYNAKEVTITWGGRLIDAGFDEGEFCKVTAASDDFTSKAGVDGEVTRSENNDKRLVVEIKVMQTALINAFLSQMRRIKGVGALFIRDRNGFSVTSATEAWLSKLPEQSWAKEANARVWTLATGPADVFIGGNNDLAQNLVT